MGILATTGTQAEAHQSLIPNEPLLEVSDKGTQILALTEITNEGNGIRSSGKPKEEQALIQALRDLNSGLEDTKSYAQRTFDKSRSVFTRNAAKKERLNSRSVANSESALFNNPDVLNRVALLARSESYRADVSAAVRTEAKKTLSAWINTNKLSSSDLSYDTANSAANHQPNSALEAIELIVTGSNRSEILRGVTDILDMAASQGYKENSIEKYLDRIEDAFDLNGNTIRDIVSREIDLALTTLPETFKNPDSLMNHDATVILDLKNALAKLAFGKNKKGLAPELKALLETDHDTKTFDTELEKVHAKLDKFAKKHANYEKLETEYERAAVDLRSLLGQDANLKVELLTDSQLKNLLSNNGVATTLNTRQSMLAKVKNGLGLNEASVEVTRANLDLASDLQLDAKEAKDNVREKFQKDNKLLRKAFEEVPQLRDYFYKVVGPRFGLGVQEDEQYFDVLKSEQESLEKDIRIAIKDEVNSLEASKANVEAKKQSIETQLVASSDKLNDFIAKNIDSTNIDSWIESIAKAQSIRKNPHGDRFLHDLHKLKNDPSLSHEEKIKLAHSAISYLETEATLDKAKGAAPLHSLYSNTSLSAKVGLSELSTASQELSNHTQMKDKRDELTRNISDIENKVEKLTDKQEIEHIVKTRMKAKLLEKQKGSLVALSDIGLIQEENSPQVIDDLEQTSSFLEQNYFNYDSTNFGESFLSSIKSLIKFLLDNMKGGN